VSGTYPLEANLSFRWGQPVSWGNVCVNPCNSGGFKLFVDGNEVGSYGVNSDSATKAASTFGAGQHSWYVQAWRTGASYVNSPTLYFTILAGTVDVRGYLWDSTGQACTSSPSSSLEIPSSGVTVNVDGTYDGTVDQDGGTAYTYNVADVPTGDHILNVSGLPTPPTPGTSYELTCVNSTTSSAAGFTASSDPTTIHLGYKEVPAAGWFHSIDGDVFGGCTQDNCAESISIAIPALTAGGFADTLIDGAGAIFANSDLSIKNPSDEDQFTSNSNKYYVKNIGGGFNASEGFRFEPPSYAIEIQDDGTGCGNVFHNGDLDPTKVYRTTRGCAQGGLNAVGNIYRTAADGVVVIFVESDGPQLQFIKDFTSQDPDRRIIFVTNSAIQFGQQVGVANPNTNTAPNIEAAIVTTADIEFESKGTDDDDSIIVEGPLVSTEGTIHFNRNRGVSNNYPAEIIRYNPIYLSALSEFGSKSLGVVDISWLLNN
jgi:hypothetical protein